jgi:hypothetical protein
MTILEKTIKEMPHCFTSNEFNKRAIQNGYSADAIKRKGLSSFIKRYATNQYPFSKTWVKFYKNNASEIIFAKPESIKLHTTAEDKGSTIQQAIKLLKNNGYKIMRPTTNYEEV